MLFIHLEEEFKTELKTLRTQQYTQPSKVRFITIFLILFTILFHDKAKFFQWATSTNKYKKNKHVYKDRVLSL